MAGIYSVSLRCSRVHFYMWLWCGVSGSGENKTSNIIKNDVFITSLGNQFYIDKLASTEKKLAEITKKYTGLSPLQVIHNRILLEAKRLLLFEDRTHKEIAYQLGFDSPASFSNFIKSKTGLAPKELTKQLAEIHK